LAAQLAVQEEQAKAAEDAAEAEYAKNAASSDLSAPAADDSYGRKLMQANKHPPTKACIKRLTHDISSIFRSPDPSIHVMPDDDDITRVDALILGPEDTPYQGGFYHFRMLFPHDYPWKSPKVLLITTDSGRVRFVGVWPLCVCVCVCVG
jgi:Ubiquitin-conjugating enzyme